MNRILPLFLLILVVSCNQSTNVDLIIHNAKIYTVDDAFNKAEALAVKDGKVIAIGAEHQILNAYQSETTIDAAGKYLYPGFIDAHSHFLGYGIEKQRLNLVGTQSFNEVVERIDAYIKENKSPWVLGRGWDQNDWTLKEYPNNDTLSKLFPDHFIALKRVDGHALLASQNVIELAGINEETKVNGGEIILKNGKPTGIIMDEAMELVNSVIPVASNEFKTEALRISQKDCFEQGLTTVCDAGLAIEEIDLINELQDSFLKIRIYAMYSASKEVMKSLDHLGYKTDRLTAKSVKLYIDGALGSRGAYLLNPYADDSSSVGSLITPSDSIKAWARVCLENGFQLNMHCIGDGGNRIALNAIGEILGGTNDKRWRIEHAQVVHPEDRLKFGSFNIIPSMQPTHATSDMYWAEERLGSVRTNYAYSLKSLMNENGLIALGTDFPVEDISPIKTFYAAVVRKDASGFPENGFLIEEGLTREESLRGITIWAAVANFEDSLKGSLEVGKFADLVLLDQDLIKCTDQALLETTVLKTWVNGELVFEK